MARSMACWLVAVLFWISTAAQTSLHSQQKVRVISDIHAGSCWQGNQSILFQFLQQTAEDDIDVLVLNGDIYDFWLLPLNKSSPSLDDLISKGLDPSLGFDMKRFRTLLRGAAKSVVTLYQDNGNHDMWLTGSLAQHALGDTSTLWEESAVTKWGVRFEHGHLNTLFNAVPPRTNKMPIGYYVTRCVASYSCAGQEQMSAWLSGLIKSVLGTPVIDDIAVETLRQPAVFKQLLGRILETATDSKVPSNMSVPIVGVVSSDQIPTAGDKSANYTLAHFIDEYADALDRFVSEFGLSQSAKMIANDQVTGALDQNFGRSSIHESMIVLGHTHVPDLQVVKRDVPQFSRTPDVLVANAGAWVKDMTNKPRHSYVDITIDDVVEDYPECYAEANGSDYRGMVHTTENGTECVAWDSVAAEQHMSIMDHRKAFSDGAFCRNHGDWSTPWCWTGHISWGNCSVGPPSAHCPVKRLRGAVAVKLIRFGNAKPLAVATRNASTGSRWTMTKQMEESEYISVVV